MKIRRIFILGREVFRSEVTEDADKSMITAIEEMIGSEDDIEYEDVEDIEYYDPVRGAEELEHLVFAPGEEELGPNPIRRPNEELD